MALERSWLLTHESGTFERFTLGQCASGPDWLHEATLEKSQPVVAIRAGALLGSLREVCEELIALHRRG